NSESFISRHCLSYDGSFVAFASDATDLASDYNGWRDIFVRDRVNGLTTLVSVDTNGGQGGGDSSEPTISADGSRITFVSAADNLAANDGSGNFDVFLHDTNTGTTTLVSVAADGGASNGQSGEGTISADGTKVVLSSDASDLVETGDTL